MKDKDLKKALMKAKKRLYLLHSDWNEFQMSEYLTQEYFKRKK